jgi:hypothetical protein
MNTTISGCQGLGLETLPSVFCQSLSGTIGKWEGHWRIGSIMPTHHCRRIKTLAMRPDTVSLHWLYTNPHESSQCCSWMSQSLEKSSTWPRAMWHAFSRGCHKVLQVCHCSPNIHLGPLCQGHWASYFTVSLKLKLTWFRLNKEIQC